MAEKPFYKSKTFWFNALTVLVAVASFYGYVPNEQLAKDVSAFLVAVSPFVNLILRFMTKQPIGLGLKRKGLGI